MVGSMLASSFIQRRRCRSSRWTETPPRGASRKARSVGCCVRRAASRSSAAGALQLALVLDAVRDRLQPCRRARAPDGREESFGGRRARARAGLRIQVSISALVAPGIEVGCGGFGPTPGKERPIAVEAQPRPLVLQERVQPRLPSADRSRRRSSSSVSFPAHAWRREQRVHDLRRAIRARSAARSFAGSA
jgi:hypothetical protein